MAQNKASLGKDPIRHGLLYPSGDPDLCCAVKREAVLSRGGKSRSAGGKGWCLPRKDKSWKLTSSRHIPKDVAFTNDVALGLHCYTEDPHKCEHSVHQGWLRTSYPGQARVSPGTRTLTSSVH